MQWRFWPGWIALVTLLWCIPAVAMAEQEDSEPQQAVSEQGDDQPADPQQDPAGEQESPDPDESVDGEQAQTGEESVDGEQQEVVGPGGRQLQTDYPGTDDAMQPRMDTGELEAIDVPEGEDPGEVYDLRVRELETRLDDLQERVFRSKSRIALLRETVLAENLAGSRAVVTFENDLGGAYNVERVIFSVDGSQVYSDVAPNGAIDATGLEVFSGPMAPGTHTVSVILGLRGSGYGIFSYAEGYEFDLRFSCQFTAEEGRTTLVTVRSFESGNMFTAHEDRPDGICEVSMVELTVDDMEDVDEDFGDDVVP